MERSELTVVIPTFRRAASLRRVLEGLRAQQDAPPFDVIVVDNAECEETREVCEAATELALRFAVERGPGKNRALNRALTEDPLAPLVVFTDDDVDPDPKWLAEVRACAERWPNASVFGGRIDVVWPDGGPPAWARDARVQELGFTAHAPLEAEGPYPEGRVPFGPNFWMRRQLIEAGHRFNERIGPNPDDRILGDETQFLRGLRRGGQRFVYNPAAIVGHRVTRESVAPGVVRRRAYDQGRGIPHERGLPRRDLLARSPLLWRTLRHALVLRDRARAASARCLPGVAPSLNPLRALGFNQESLRLARERAQD